jgi:histidyl-tRNA synthetase
VTVLEHHGLAVPEPRPQVFVAPLGVLALRESFVLVERLRGVGLRAEIGYDEKSLRSQLRRANRLGAAYTVMLGERELVAGKVSLKDMQGGEQVEWPLAEVVAHLQERLQKSS